MFGTIYIINLSLEQANNSSLVPKTHNKKRNTTSEPIENDNQFCNILSGVDDDFSDEKNYEDDTEQPLYPCPECTQCFTSRQDLKV